LDEDGCIIIPKGPGLGIDLDVEVFERYRVE
jgi:L-alanine-DL-glutamate epimerase-like enolase superfamily enzyme